MQLITWNLVIMLVFVINIILGCNAPKIIEKNTLDLDKITVDSVVSDPVMVNPLVVSFFSRGAGIDHIAYKYLLLSINEHNASNKTKLIFNTASWGREGEKDLCFPKQSTINFNSFVATVKSALDSNKNVHLYFNAPCNNLK